VRTNVQLNEDKFVLHFKKSNSTLIRFNSTHRVKEYKPNEILRSRVEAVDMEISGRIVALENYGVPSLTK
jgi:hypothetical protein